jgi:tetratricopeptide (TPR) repeat protein
MIVRDEAKSLGRCLDAARPFVDEICVVDTGSRDATIEIARERGARVQEMDWPHHFSAARNVSLEMARGDWILVLDADETLRPEGREAFDLFVDSADYEGGQIGLVNDYGDGRSLSCLVMRLFRNRSEYRFEGAIHEQIAHRVLAGSKARGRRIGRLAATIDHDGYTEESRQEKGKDARNQLIFERALEERPEDPYLWFKFGDFQRRGSRPKEQLASFRRAAQLLDAYSDQAIAESPYAAEAYAFLALEELRGGDRAEAARVLLRGARCAPTQTFHWVSGHVSLARGRFVEAEASFRACRAMDGALVSVPAQPGVTTWRSVSGLGRALLGQGKAEEAAEIFLSGARTWPRDPELQRAAARVEISRKEFRAALARIEELVAAHPRDAEAWRIAVEILLETGCADRADRFLLRARDHADGEGDRRAVEALAGQVALACGDVDRAEAAFVAAGQHPEARAGLHLLELIASDEPHRVEADLRPALKDVARRFAVGPSARALDALSRAAIGRRLQPALA